jgi:hypothetical protein
MDEGEPQQSTPAPVGKVRRVLYWLSPTYELAEGNFRKFLAISAVGAGMGLLSLLASLLGIALILAFIVGMYLWYLSW